MDYNSKEYQKYVLNSTIQEIMKNFNLSKKDATNYFYKALAYNLVQAEIDNQISFLIEKGI